MMAAGPPAKRPPHIRLAAASAGVAVAAALLCDCRRVTADVLYDPLAAVPGRARRGAAGAGGSGRGGRTAARRSDGELYPDRSAAASARGDVFRRRRQHGEPRVVSWPRRAAQSVGYLVWPLRRG